MPRPLRACAPLVPIVALAVGAVPLFAQSHTERAWDARTVAAVQDGARTMAVRGVVRTYQPGHAADVAPVLPATLAVPEMYRSLLEAMLLRSPTFRRQCRRIAAADGVAIVLRHSLTPESRFRATTRLITTSEGLVAYVNLSGTGGHDPVELIAHELEHVIERLDGVDLRRLADLPRTRVHVRDGGAFETLRAQRTGLLVAREVRGASR
jgi:hypothetical protein